MEFPVPRKELTLRTKTVTDELNFIVRMLCAKYPDRSEVDVTSLVDDVYERLASEATVTAHLIPLTVNRCQKLLTRQLCTANQGPRTVEPMTIAS